MLFLKLVFFQWSIVKSDDFLIVLLYSASLIRNVQKQIWLQRSRFFDDKIEIEITRIFNQNCILSGFIYIDISETDQVDIMMRQWIVVWWLLNWMMKCISNSFNIQRDWSCFLLDMTKDVIIVFSLNSWSKSDLYWNLVISSNNSWHWWDLQWIGIFWIASNTFLVKWEIERNML